MKRFIFLYVLFAIAIMSCSDKAKIKKNMTVDELEKIYKEMMYDLVDRNGMMSDFVIQLAVSNVMKQTYW
jgi:hypothetical protein